MESPGRAPNHAGESNRRPTNEEQQEGLVIAVPHTVAYPGAVVVHPAVERMLTHPTFLMRPCYRDTEAFQRAVYFRSACKRDAMQPVQDIWDVRGASVPEHAALAHFAVMRPRRLGLAALLAVSDLAALQQTLRQSKDCLSWLRIHGPLS